MGDLYAAPLGDDGKQLGPWKRIGTGSVTLTVPQDYELADRLLGRETTPIFYALTRELGDPAPVVTNLGGDPRVGDVVRLRWLGRWRPATVRRLARRGDVADPHSDGIPDECLLSVGRGSNGWVPVG